MLVAIESERSDISSSGCSGSGPPKKAATTSRHSCVENSQLSRLKARDPQSEHRSKTLHPTGDLGVDCPENGGFASSSTVKLSYLRGFRVPIKLEQEKDLMILFEQFLDESLAGGYYHHKVTC
jgi:hypothetical protein